MKVWFQNRRMKWRHSKQESKLDKNKTVKTENKNDENPDNCDSSIESDSCSSDDEHEIDIEAG